MLRMWTISWRVLLTIYHQLGRCRPGIRWSAPPPPSGCTGRRPGSPPCRGRSRALLSGTLADWSAGCRSPSSRWNARWWWPRLVCWSTWTSREEERPWLVCPSDRWCSGDTPAPAPWSSGLDPESPRHRTTTTSTKPEPEVLQMFTQFNFPFSITNKLTKNIKYRFPTNILCQDSCQWHCNYRSHVHS